MSTPRPLICVFAGSSTPKDSAILEAATALGTAIGEGGYDILYGGGSKGVMGAVSNAAYAAGAHVNAVLLERFAGDEEATPATILEVVKNEIERFPRFLAENPVALFVLPGGTGTLREAMQGLETAVYDNGPPVVLAKVGDYLGGIRDYFNQAVEAGMISPQHKGALREWQPGQSIQKLLKAPLTMN